MEDRKNIGGVVEIEWFCKKTEEYVERWLKFCYPQNEEVFFEGVKMTPNYLSGHSFVRLEFSGSFYCNGERKEANWHYLDLQDFLRIVQDLDYHFEKLEDSSKTEVVQPQNRYNLIDEDFKKEEKKEKV